MADLKRTPRGWIEVPPSECPNGHPLIGGSHTVGVQVCGGEHGRDHRTYRCDCGATIYVPPLGSSCRVLHGAAGVRNL